MSELPREVQTGHQEKNLLTMKVVKHWNRLSGDVVDALCLLKKRLNEALSNTLDFWLACSGQAAGLGDH